MRFDLLVKGGEVVDPGGGNSGVMDVGVRRDRIAAIDDHIPIDAAHQVIDARGYYVTPGLIDLHTHTYRGVTYWGVDADPIGARSGVTTWVDAGSAGAITLPGFRDFVVKSSSVRIYSFLNISYLGLVAPDYELTKLEYCDLALFKRLVDLNRDLVLGVKVRMGSPTVGDHGIAPMRRARQAADECGLPLMVHVAFAPPEISEVLDLLRPGDILTHCFTGLSMRIVDERGRILDAAKRAVERGVVLDLGHGSGSFAYQTAEALLAAGYGPDVISSDLHQVSRHVPDVIDPLAEGVVATVRRSEAAPFDLTSCLTKLLNLGMPLADVIQAATSAPARAIGLERELGTLRPGSLADIALFVIEDGSFLLDDVFGNSRLGKERIRNTLTILGGRVLRQVDEFESAPWIDMIEE